MKNPLQQKNSSIEIYRGAEAVIYRDGSSLIKSRVVKSYRNKDLDLDLRKRRTKKEAKVLLDTAKIISVPKLISVDEKEMKIVMEFIDGSKVRDVLESFKSVELRKVCEEIGCNVAKLHNNSIIHGDLTTSNFIVKKLDGDFKNKVYFIDFGLSFTSESLEDKAVDLHLLRQALESKHYKIFTEAFGFVLSGYENESKDYDEVLKRFREVEKRGRNMAKLGG